MLKNLANYKVGRTYKFSIKNKGEKTVAVLAKGNKQLELKVDGIVGWFNSEELTSVKKDYHKKPAKVVVAEVSDAILPEKYQGNLGIAPPKTVQKVTKVVAKTVVAPVRNPEIMKENISDMEYAFKSFRHEVRLILKRHGVMTEPTWPHKKIFEALDKALPKK